MDFLRQSVRRSEDGVAQQSGSADRSQLPHEHDAQVLPFRLEPPHLTRLQWAAEIAMRMFAAATLFLFVCVTVHQYMLDRSRISLLFFVAAESLTVSLALITRIPRKRDWSPLSLAVAIGASYYFLAFQIGPGKQLVPEWCAAAVQVTGALIQILSKCALRRSFGLLPANRGVVALGPYQIVRHPMYLSYFIADVGFLLANFGWRNLIVVLVSCVLQIWRLLREERLLSEDDAYRQYMRRVRYRLLFGLF